MTWGEWLYSIVTLPLAFTYHSFMELLRFLCWFSFWLFIWLFKFLFIFTLFCKFVLAKQIIPTSSSCEDDFYLSVSACLLGRFKYGNTGAKAMNILYRLLILVDKLSRTILDIQTWAVILNVLYRFDRFKNNSFVKDRYVRSHYIKCQRIYFAYFITFL